MHMVLLWFVLSWLYNNHYQWIRAINPYIHVIQGHFTGIYWLASMIAPLLMNQSRRIWIVNICTNNTMTSSERHVVSNHQSFDCLFNSLYGPISKKHQNLCYWPFVKGIHRRPVNSSHKGPVTQKRLPFDYVIIITASLQFDTLKDTRLDVVFMAEQCPS